MALTEKQRRFVAEYLVDLNATQAAIRAGYSAKSAEVNGPRLLGNAGVAAAVAAGQAKALDKLEVTRERVLNELARVAFSDVGGVLDLTGEEPRLKPANEIDEDARRAISSVKVKRYFEGHGKDAKQVEVTEFRLWSKDAALEKLGRHLGLLRDRVEVTGEGGKPLIPVHVFQAWLTKPEPSKS